jgi:hypothetical protein
MATNPSSLPGIPRKPNRNDFEEPVAWLFGRQFIATFKYVLLYTAFKGKLDSRDWMKNEVIDVEQLWKQSTDQTETAGNRTAQLNTSFSRSRRCLRKTEGSKLKPKIVDVFHICNR